MLPPTVQTLCQTLSAPPRLVTHLTLVHEAAVELVDGLFRSFPTLKFDADAVLFGAATHDLGKVRHPEELTGLGSRHEESGAVLLEQNGIPADLARFARTHGSWSQPLPLEDLLVALADTVWKGERNDLLETRVNDRIVEATKGERWEVFGSLDDVLLQIAEKGNERLAKQKASAKG